VFISACDIVYNFLHSFTLHAFLSALISSTLGATLSTLPKRISYEAYHQIKMNFDVSNLDDGSRLKILDYVLREKKVSCEDLGVSRVMVYNCRKGKYKVPDEVVGRAA